MESCQISNSKIFLKLIVIICLSVKSSLQCNQGELRLVNGSQPNQGRVEIYIGNCWGTICDDWWDDTDAQVVCRQLGYRSDGAQALTDAYFGQGIGPITLDGVSCYSSETTLLQCSHNPLFVHDCAHREDAGVTCRDECRLASINATSVDQGTSATLTISIAWQLMNDTLDTPRYFEISCFNERRHVRVTENNKTFITHLELGAHNYRDPFSSYNCCVSAVYNTLQPATPVTKICTQVESDLEPHNYYSTSIMIPTSTIMSAQPPTSCNSALSSAGIVGGVLGCIVTLLIVLLGVALAYLLVQAKKNKTKHHPDAVLRGNSVTIMDNVSYTKMTTMPPSLRGSFVQESQNEAPANPRVTEHHGEEEPKYVNITPGPTYEPIEVMLTSPDSERLQHDPAGLPNAYATYDVPRKL